MSMQLTYLSVLRADTRNILRDSSLFLILVVPFLLVPLVRYGGAALIDLFPEVAEYASLVVLMFGAMVAIFPAFVMGFVMMDEKDGGINQVLRVLPFNLNKLIGLRVLTMIAVGLFNAIFFFALNGLVSIGIVEMIVLSTNVSILAPIMAFEMLCISSNKIEAAVVLKGISFVIVIAFAQFFIPGGLKYLLAPIPTFWVCRAFEEISNFEHFALFSAIGVSIQLVYLSLLWKLFLRKW
jgi:fluoroquinolone transport system permease protein